MEEAKSLHGHRQVVELMENMFRCQHSSIGIEVKEGHNIVGGSDGHDLGQDGFSYSREAILSMKILQLVEQHE
jgi:hypothetical protein